MPPSRCWTVLFSPSTSTRPIATTPCASGASEPQRMNEPRATLTTVPPIHIARSLSGSIDSLSSIFGGVSRMRVRNASNLVRQLSGADCT